MVGHTPFLHRVPCNGCRTSQHEWLGSSLASPKATADTADRFVATGWSRPMDQGMDSGSDSSLTGGFCALRQTTPEYCDLSFRLAVFCSSFRSQFSHSFRRSSLISQVQRIPFRYPHSILNFPLIALNTL